MTSEVGPKIMGRPEGQAIRADVNDERPDIEAIMAQIRADIRTGVASLSADGAPKKVPEMGKSSTTPLLYSEELNYLNANWHNWRPATEITSHRKIVGPIIVKLKKFLTQVVWNSLLKEYFERERAFTMNVVRVLNNTARYIDTRDTEIFWQLIRKIDNDTAGGEERLSKLFDQMDSTVRTIELGLARRIGDLDGAFRELHSRFGNVQQEMRRLDDGLRGFERVVALFARNPGGSGSEPAAVSATPAVGNPNVQDVDYLLLENRYRGSEEDIQDRMKDYVDLFRDAPGRVIDIGCGRGEFLGLLREAKIDAVGIDLDSAMVERCKQKGLPVELGDGLEYLRNAEDGSLGGVFAAQVVEHLTRAQLAELFALVQRKLHPRGKAAFETINPQSYTALARNFFRDPTHVWPLHPDTLSFAMEMQGLRIEQVLYRSPYPESAMLQPVEISSALPGRWQILLQQLNDNVHRLNELLFGFQDYCIVAAPGLPERSK